jgi:hypothetical protein
MVLVSVCGPPVEWCVLCVVCCVLCVVCCVLCVCACVCVCVCVVTAHLLCTVLVIYMRCVVQRAQKAEANPYCIRDRIFTEKDSSRFQ